MAEKHARKVSSRWGVTWSHAPAATGRTAHGPKVLLLSAIQAHGLGTTQN